MGVKVRLGERCMRATSDLDVSTRARGEELERAFRARLAEGWERCHRRRVRIAATRLRRIVSLSPLRCAARSPRSWARPPRVCDAPVPGVDRVPRQSVGRARRGGVRSRDRRAHAERLRPHAATPADIRRRFGISLVIDLFAERQIAPPTTAAEFHSALARQHPRLFAAHADLHKVGPATSIHREAAVIFRGTRCLSCETIVARPSELIDRLCADCRRETLL
ncbi:MAG: hypothetical protein JWQ64_3467 [Subtercola sp.]|nr:hypothetical protein [Subtercola sp.]